MKKKIFVIFAIIILLCTMCVSLVACKHNHEWKFEWKTDENYHWHECTKKNCKENDSFGEHTLVSKTDEKDHWSECVACGYVKGKNAHKFNSDLVCTECNFKHEHIIKYDDVNHWYLCGDFCDKSHSPVVHSYANNECAICAFKKGTEGLLYSLNRDGNSYAVSGISSDVESIGKDIVISEYYKGKPVTVIEESVFAGMKNILSIFVPKTITTIKKGAFSGCEGLAEITIPLSVTTIEERVFEGCYGITINAETKSKPAGWIIDWEINQFSKFPIVWDSKNNNVAEDGYIYFVDRREKHDPIKYGIKNGEAIIAKQPRIVKDINLNTQVAYEGQIYKVTAIEDYAFYYYEDITGIDIVSTITTIGDYAFAKCSNLFDIVWGLNGLSIKEIGVGAFEDCVSLTEFEIPKNLTTISAYMLGGCSGIRYITIPSTITRIEDYAFSGCSKLIIKCEMSQQLEGWGNKWNDSNRPVIWNCNGNDTTEDGYKFVEVGVTLLGINEELLEAILIETEFVNGSVANINATINYNQNIYNIVAIADNALANKSNITEIKLTTNIRSIGAGAFANCVLLNKITFDGTMEQWKAIEKGENWDYNTGTYVVQCNDGSIGKFENK